MIKNVSLMLASTCLTLFGVDSYLAFAHLVPDTRGKLEVVTQLREKGVDAFPQVFGMLFAQDGLFKIAGKDVLPLSGVANKTVVYCNESGQWLIYDSDEYGFHNPRGYWDRKNNVDVVILGDSFAHGACVPGDKNAAALIRKKFKRTVNLGMGASGQLYQLGMLKEYAGELKPKVVLWFFDEMNDLNDLLHEKNMPTLVRYVQPGFRQDLIHKQPEIDAALLRYTEQAVARYGVPWNKLTPTDRSACPVCGSSVYEAGRFTPAVDRDRAPRLHWLRDRLALKEIRRLIRGGLRSTLPAPSSPSAAAATPVDLYTLYKNDRENERLALPVLRQAWQAGKDFVRGWDGTMYIVYLPSEPKYKEPRLVAEDLQLHDEVVALAREMRFKVIDATEAFNAHPKPLSLWQGHYNDAGYGVLANAILRGLQDDPALNPRTMAGSAK